VLHRLAIHDHDKLQRNVQEPIRRRRFRRIDCYHFRHLRQLYLHSLPAKRQACIHFVWHGQAAKD